jgi:hypothetical protein
MNKHPGRLDHDYQMIVFVQDLERYRLRAHRGWSRVIEGQLDVVAGGEVIACGRRDPIHKARTTLEERGDPHPAEPAKLGGKKLIKPAAPFGGSNVEPELLWVDHLRMINEDCRCHVESALALVML